LTGVSATGSLGTLAETHDSTQALTGVVVTVSIGTVVPSGGDVPTGASGNDQTRLGGKDSLEASVAVGFGW
jgi:hypothetical protein